ncbi:membrane protein insertion efficiency factor YidD [Candidatus Latescibacterota bacterium]
MTRLLIGCVRAYQLCLSPILPSACRFQPTCSEYAVEALSRYGARVGLAKTLRRLLRCHPFGPFGYDPVE